jgi:K+-transporting ATPase ATPase C chain
MTGQLLVAARMAAATLVLTGLAYPLLVTGIARVTWPRQAAGSLVTVEGKTAGSELIGQRFGDPAYFQGRPSAAGYDGAASSGSNLGPTSARLHARVTAEIERLRRENPRTPATVPIDLVTASGSGLDPHVSPEAAYWQVPRVAAERGAAESEIRRLVDHRIEGRTFGLLGEPRINVLLLNIDLDARFPRR